MSDQEAPILDEIKDNPVNSVVDRIGYGKYQALLLIGLCIITVADGAEITLITIISFMLEEEWDLNDFELGMLGGLVLIGMSLGYFFSGLAQGRLGRVKILWISVSIILVAGVVSALMVQIWSLSVLRMLVGFGIAFSVPSVLALTGQMCPTPNRGRFLMLIELSFAFGQIFILLMVLIFAPNLESEMWRFIVLCGSLPVIPAMIILYIILIESPLYLSETNKAQECISNLNRMAVWNSSDELTEEEKKQIRAIELVIVKESSVKLRKLFGPGHRDLTLKFMVIWVLLVSSYYSLLYIMPYYLGDDNDDSAVVYELLLIMAFQVPSTLASLYIIEHELFGRKNSMIYLSVATVPVIVTLTYQDNQIVSLIMIVVAMGLINLAFNLLFVYTTEMYETELRTLGLGVLNVIGRSVAAGSMYLMIFLYHVDPIYPFIVFAGMHLVVGLFCYFLPYDSTGLHLDSKYL